MKIWLLIDNKKDGPHHDFEVRSMINNKDLEPDTLVWHEGMEKWEPIQSLALFEDSFVTEKDEDPLLSNEQELSAEETAEEEPEIRNVDASNVKAYLEELAKKEDREPHVPPRKYTAEGEPVTNLHDGEIGVFLWRRMFARILDTTFLGFILYFAAIFAHRDPVGFVFKPEHQIFIFFLLNFYEILCIHLFGSSVGKAILGIRIESRSGPNVGIIRAILRGLVVTFSVSVFTNPMFAPVLLVLCIFFAKKREMLPWDIYGGSVARGLPLTRMRIIGTLVFFFSLNLISWLATPKDLRQQNVNQLKENIEKIWDELKDKSS